MTNEKLVRRYYGGDERALEELYRRNLGLIRRIARETAREFNCLHMDRERPGELSGYTKTILDDLCGEGALEFLTRVQSREYDESRAVFATYLYPHLKGRMTRWLEQHIGKSFSEQARDGCRPAGTKAISFRSVQHRRDRGENGCPSGTGCQAHPLQHPFCWCQ
ncbi:MAG: hypothetical protein ACLRNW_27405 [Neglectibacter sp.]